MELSEVKILINKYLDGDTSRNEEITLANYFANNNDIPDELKPIKDMFDSFVIMRQESVARVINTPKRKTISLRIVATMAAACAVIGVILTSISLLNREQEPIFEPQIVCHINGTLVEDEAIARAETERILGGVSENIYIAMAKIDNITSYSNRK